MGSGFRLVLALLVLVVFVVGFPLGGVVGVSAAGKKAVSKIEVPLVVNVCKNTTITDNKIKSNVKKVNEIWKQANIRFVLKKINRDFNCETEQHGDEAVDELQKRGKNEIAKKPYSGKGVKITIISQIPGNPGANGITKLGDPTSIIVKQGAAGDSWAHEIGHGLGLDHGMKSNVDKDGDKMVPDFDVDGDGQWETAKDRGNLMYGVCSLRTGTKLVDKQIETARKNAKNIGTEFKKKNPYLRVSSSSRIYVDGLYDIYFVSNGSYTWGYPQADLSYLRIYSPAPYLGSEWVVGFNGLYPSGPVNLTISIYLDTDGNPYTGLNGYDRVLTVYIVDAYPFSGNYTAVVRDLTTQAQVMRGTVAVSSIRGTLMSELEAKNATGVTYHSISDSVILNVTDALAGAWGLGCPTCISPSARVEITYNGTVGDSLNFTLVLPEDVGPSIAVSSVVLPQNGSFDVFGAGFTPNSNVIVMFEDLVNTTVVSGEKGEFTATLTLANVGEGDYLLTAVDEDGWHASIIVTVAQPQRPTATTTTTTQTTTQTIVNTTTITTTYTSTKPYTTTATRTTTRTEVKTTTATKTMTNPMNQQLLYLSAATTLIAILLAAYTLLTKYRVGRI